MQFRNYTDSASATTGEHAGRLARWRDPAPARSVPRCLVVDDDAALRTATCAYLDGFGFQSLGAANGAQMQARMVDGDVDLIVLDVSLPDADGLALCAALRRHSTLPVIMLSPQDDLTSRVLGLELGADDCLAKPFEPRELVARAKAVLRRQGGDRARNGPPTASTVMEFEGWRFDRVRHQLLSPQQVLMPLSSADGKLLRAFADHPRRVLSRDQLLDLTRGADVAIGDRSIDLAVSRLRQKLGASPGGLQLIHTVRGAGYRFDADIRPCQAA